MSRINTIDKHDIAEKIYKQIIEYKQTLNFQGLDSELDYINEILMRDILKNSIMKDRAIPINKLIEYMNESAINICKKFLIQKDIERIINNI